MLVGGQAARPHLGQQLGDTGITGQIDPQHQGVDEKTHQLVERRIATPGDREPNRHIRIRAELGQQHRQGGLHHHETGRVVLASRPSDPLLHSAASPPSHWRRDNPPVADYRGAGVAVEWPAELQQRVARVAREHNATSFMVMQAALAVLLAKLSANSEVAVGFPIAGRGDPGAR